MIECKLSGYLRSFDFREAKNKLKNQYLYFVLFYEDQKTISCVCFDEQIINTFKNNRENLLGKKISVEGTLLIQKTKISEMVYNTRISVNALTIKLIIDDLI